jgi:gliding motility-associated-like protein
VIDTVKLFVSNGVCVDSATHIIPLAYDTLKAIFSAPEFYCPGDELIVTDTSTGKIMSYFWQYSDGETSTLPQPPTRTFPTPAQEENDVMLTLTVTDSIGCTDTVSHLIRVMRSCFIAVPTAFTPDAGFNNYLYPLSGFRAINLSFSVYNRFGQLVFSSHNYNNRWDGTIGGTPQPSGTYVWMLNYIDPDSLKPVSQKGTTVLIR